MITPTCEFCRESIGDHEHRVFGAGIVTCYLTSGLTIRTETSAPDLAVTIGGADTPDGRGSTSDRDRPGAVAADHYTGQAVIAAAVAFFRASSDDEVDRSLDVLHAAVRRYLAVAAGGSDTSTGRHAASGDSWSGPYRAYLHYAGMAREMGRTGKPSAHARTCPALELDHECAFDTRMHGAVLVRPTGERVAA